MPRVSVNLEYCAGTGLCANICPEVFEVREGFAHVLVDNVDASQQGKVAEAVTLCPTSALEFVEEE